MLKSYHALEHKVDDRIHKFLFPSESPISEIYDALTKMKAFVAQQIQLAEQAEQAKVPAPCSQPCQQECAKPENANDNSEPS